MIPHHDTNPTARCLTRYICIYIRQHTTLLVSYNHTNYINDNMPYNPLSKVTIVNFLTSDIHTLYTFTTLLLHFLYALLYNFYTFCVAKSCTKSTVSMYYISDYRSVVKKCTKDIVKSVQKKLYQMCSKKVCTKYTKSVAKKYIQSLVGMYRKCGKKV
jgi:hypothetical protein